jgi:hypothetical protein
MQCNCIHNKRADSGHSSDCQAVYLHTLYRLQQLIQDSKMQYMFQRRCVCVHRHSSPLRVPSAQDDHVLPQCALAAVAETAVSRDIIHQAWNLVAVYASTTSLVLQR